MRFVFLMDPLEQVKPHKDTSFAFMQGALRRDHQVCHLPSGGISLQGAQVVFDVVPVESLSADETPPFRCGPPARLPLDEVDAIFIRTDPPFDERCGLTIVPGAALSLGDSRRFFRSQPANPYHELIERSYGAAVVTTSEHLNLGIDSTPELFRAYRLLRAEACLFLALSASSPFLDGEATGYCSTRWKIFPHTPRVVPLFADQGAYVDWVHAQLASGAMQNARHLWAAVRPNGRGVPEHLERLELRVCDSVEDLRLVLALLALFEARVQQSLSDPRLDPLASSRLKEPQLLELCQANELAAARDSLDAELHDWRTGRTLTARAWIAELLDETEPVARTYGFAGWLGSIRVILERGSCAQLWLARHRRGESVQEIIRGATREMQAREQELARWWSHR